MAQNTRTPDSGVRPGTPEQPTPPAGEAETAQTDAEARHRRISEAAYYRAERRGFQPGAEDDDWLEAEKDLDRPPKPA